MVDRTVTDSAGRTWTCAAESRVLGGSNQWQDAVVSCATPSVSGPVCLTLGWQWHTMAANGLARLISQASPVPRR
jgi:hypothetical protein